MPHAIFLSSVFEDQAYADRVRGWCEGELLGREYVTITEGRDVRQLGDAKVWSHLRSRIQGASAVLALLGSDTHNHDWVRKELALATSLHKRVLLMRIPGTHGAAPVGFRHLPELRFDPSALRAALAQT
jgi:hypothetical protein